MQWFKRSPWELIKWCLYSPLLGLIVYFGAGLFTTSVIIKCIAGVVCALALLLFSLFFDNVRLSLDENGTLTYYKMGREKQAIPLAGCKTDYRHTSERVFFTSADITLSITRQQDGQAVTTNLDCSALGLAQFRRMFAAIRAVTGEAMKPSALAAAPGRWRKRKKNAAVDAGNNPGESQAAPEGAKETAPKEIAGDASTTEGATEPSGGAAMAQTTKPLAVGTSTEKRPAALPAAEPAEEALAAAQAADQSIAEPT